MGIDYLLARTLASRLFSPVDSWVIREAVGMGWKLGSLDRARHQGSEKSGVFWLGIVTGERGCSGSMRVFSKSTTYV